MFYSFLRLMGWVEECILLDMLRSKQSLTIIKNEALGALSFGIHGAKNRCAFKCVIKITIVLCFM